MFWSSFMKIHKGQIWLEELGWLKITLQYVKAAKIYANIIKEEKIKKID